MPLPLHAPQCALFSFCKSQTVLFSLFLDNVLLYSPSWPCTAMYIRLAWNSYRSGWHGTYRHPLTYSVSPVEGLALLWFPVLTWQCDTRYIDHVPWLQMVLASSSLFSPLKTMPPISGAWHPRPPKLPLEPRSLGYYDAISPSMSGSGPLSYFWLSYLKTYASSM